MVVSKTHNRSTILTLLTLTARLLVLFDGPCTSGELNLVRPRLPGLECRSVVLLRSRLSRCFLRLPHTSGLIRYPTCLI